jgi:hypothetical protein
LYTARGIELFAFIIRVILNKVVDIHRSSVEVVDKMAKIRYNILLSIVLFIVS